MLEENIFGIQAIELGIQYSPNFGARFDGQQEEGPAFAQILERLANGQEREAYFLKWSDTEHKIILPWEDPAGQLELVVSWLDQLFYYELKLTKRKKTRFEVDIRLPQEQGTFLKKTCVFRLIPEEEPYRADETLEILKQKVDELQVSSQVNANQQMELWDKYIQARKMIVESLQAPFQIRQIGASISQHHEGYNLGIPLRTEKNPAYLQLEEALQKVEIYQSFDQEGRLSLPLEDIFEGLDYVLQKEFVGKIERGPIGAILKISPPQFHDVVQQELDKMGIPGKVFQHMEHGYLSVSPPAGLQGLYKLSEQVCSFGLKFQFYSVAFEIRGIHTNLQEWLKAQKKSVFLSPDLKTKRGGKMREILPQPQGNVFVIRKYSIEGILSYQMALRRIFGPEKVSVKSVQLRFVPQKGRKDLLEEIPFEENFWKRLKRECYRRDIAIECNPGSDTIYFEFDTEERFNYLLSQLEEMEGFEVNYQPENYRFRVKTHIISGKNQEEKFTERINRLAGAEIGQWAGSKFISLGRLKSRASNQHKLVVGQRIFHDKERKEVEKRLLQLEEGKFGDWEYVVPNLRGDEAKIKWLKAAMRKVSNPGSKHFEKPVSETLGKVIFDASLARPTHKDLSPEGEAWKELSQHQILPLNDSQKTAVLRAMHAEDLCLLQGPPGTGKTTVIAEMIWHMVRTNPEQKILLTSETNLAVDNALDRLLKSGQTLVKPLRFGKSEKMEEEGKQFSWDRISTWLGNQPEPVSQEEEEEEEILDDHPEEEAEFMEKEEDPAQNSVQKWMTRIAERAYEERDPRFEQVLQTWSEGLAMAAQETRQKFADAYRRHANVVGSTCTSTGSPHFGKQYQDLFNHTEPYRKEGKTWQHIPLTFDAVIMDEASKATPPEMLMPLCFGKKSIIIGDHRQLPPMLQDKAFREALEEYGGQDGKKLAEEIDREYVETSQFERLILNPAIHDSVKATFNVQYRMHPHINDVIRQFYLDEGGLEPGLDPAKVDLPDLSEPQSRHHGFYLPGFISPDVHTIWVDVGEPEELEGTSRQNPAEADAVRRVLECLHRAEGFAEYQAYWDKNIKNPAQRQQEKEIGLISFYGSQVRLLENEVKRYAESKLDIPIRLRSVDKFQGMERNVVIVSTVRSDAIRISHQETRPNHDIGFARSPKRLNVALSRARRLLIVVGNKAFFARFQVQGAPIYQQVVEEIQTKGKVISYQQLIQLTESWNPSK